MGAPPVALASGAGTGSAAAAVAAGELGEVGAGAEAGAGGAGRCWAMNRPSVTASATTRHSSAPERIASSFPGITWVITSGSQLVSTTATTGRPSLLASVTAMCSFLVSMTKMASGSRSSPRMPPRLRWSFSSSRVWRRASFLGMASKSPAFSMASNSFIRLTRVETVWKLVSMPPSHRSLT